MYSKILDPSQVPQSEPLNDRQVPNAAGGYVYQVSDWDQLDRFLLMGSTGGNYYFDERSLTRANLESVLACIKADGVKAVHRIEAISKAGRATKNDPAIFCLALIMKHGDEEARKAASSAIPNVCRTGTHLLSFAAEMEGLKRGWGSTAKRGVANWFLTHPDRLAYQALKYSQRNGWALRDLLRLSHPKTTDSVPLNKLRPIFEYILKGQPCGVEIIDAALSLRTLSASDPKDVEKAAVLIFQHKLPRECVPTEFLNKREIWSSLLQDMPLTAMIRNLGKMTSIGLIAPLSNAERKVVLAFGNRDILRKARVHPLTLLVAMNTYKMGRGIKGSLTWEPNSAVLMALSEAVWLAMETAPRSNLKTLVAVDESVSMQTQTAGGLMLHQVTACMAAAASRSFDYCHTIAFETRWRNLDIKGRRLDDVVNLFGSVGCGTDVSVPIHVALETISEPLDLIQIYTDSETWAGRNHPEVVLNEYREKINPNVKVAIVAMTANKSSALDTKDMNVLQCVGFDASLPQVLSAFAEPTRQGTSEDSSEVETETEE